MKKIICIILVLLFVISCYGLTFTKVNNVEDMIEGNIFLFAHENDVMSSNYHASLNNRLDTEILPLNGQETYETTDKDYLYWKYVYFENGQYNLVSYDRKKAIDDGTNSTLIDFADHSGVHCKIFKDPSGEKFKVKIYSQENSDRRLNFVSAGVNEYVVFATDQANTYDIDIYQANLDVEITTNNNEVYFTTLDNITFNYNQDYTIRYTTDEVTPSLTSPIYDPAQGIDITNCTTIIAQCFDSEGHEVGRTFRRAYIIQDVFMSEINLIYNDASSNYYLYVEIYNNNDNIINLEGYHYKAYLGNSVEKDLDFHVENIQPHQTLVIHDDPNSTLDESINQLNFDDYFYEPKNNFGIFYKDTVIDVFGEYDVIPTNGWFVDNILINEQKNYTIKRKETVVKSNYNWTSSHRAEGEEWYIDETYSTDDLGQHQTNSGEGTPIEMTSFDVVNTANGDAKVDWFVDSDVFSQGYIIYRAVEPFLNNAVRINNNVIPSVNCTNGHHYAYIDEELDSQCDIYYYWIESLDISGHNEIFGPVSICLSNHNNSNPMDNNNKTGIVSVSPNPFNPTTSVLYQINKDEFNQNDKYQVSMDIYNLKGQKITSLYNDHQSEGRYNIIWNGNNYDGSKCASGIYFVKLKINEKIFTKKIALMK